MIGSNALSCSCPASAAKVTVTSLPMTSNAIWFTTSGITGFTLPGMMREPACIGGRLISPKPARGPDRQQPQVVADLRQLDRDALQHARELHERAAVLRRLDEIGRGDERNAGDLAQAPAHDARRSRDAR